MSKRLRKSYIKAVKGYITAFEKKQDVSIDFDMYSLANFDVADYCMSLFNIIYDIDANVPAGYIFEYYSGCLERYLDGDEINYPHWLSINKGIKIEFKYFS